MNYPSINAAGLGNILAFFCFKTLTLIVYHSSVATGSCIICKRSTNSVSCCGVAVIIDEEYEIEDGGAYPQAKKEIKNLTDDQIFLKEAKKHLAEYCKKLAAEKNKT